MISKLVARLIGNLSQRRLFSKVGRPPTHPVANNRTPVQRANPNKHLAYFQDSRQFEQLLRHQPSVAESCQLLRRLESQTDFEWNTTFPKYAYFAEKLFERERTPQETYQLFLVLTDLHKASGKRTSQNLTKIYNKLLGQAMAESKLPLARLLQLLLNTCNFNPPKARHLFLESRNATATVQSLQEALLLLQIMKQTGMYPSILVDTCMDITFHNSAKLTPSNVLITLQALGGSRKVVSSDYLTTLLKTLPDSLTGTPLLHITSAVSNVEKHMGVDSGFLFELNSFYKKSFEVLSKFDLRLWHAKLLIKLVNCLRRASYEHEQLIRNLVQFHLQSPVKQLQQTADSVLRPRKPMMLSNMLSLLHLLASIDQPLHGIYQRFVEYCLALLTHIENIDNPPELEERYIPRAIWSLCVLLPQKVIHRHIWHLMKLLQVRLRERGKEAQRTQFFQGCNFILEHCLAYFRPIDSQLCELIQSNITEFKKNQGMFLQQIRIRTSATQRSVRSAILQLGVPCIEEYKIDHIYCDIYIPDLGQYHKLFGVESTDGQPVKNVVIELHGFQHFLRNTGTLKGSSHLKKRLLEMQGYHYYYIAVDEWSSLPADQKAYIKNFLKKVYTDVQRRMQPI